MEVLKGSFPLDTEDKENAHKGETQREREKLAMKRGKKESRMKPLNAATGKFFEVEPADRYRHVLIAGSRWFSA